MQRIQIHSYRSHQNSENLCLSYRKNFYKLFESQRIITKLSEKCVSLKYTNFSKLPIENQL